MVNPNDYKQLTMRVLCQLESSGRVAEKPIIDGGLQD